MRSILFLGAFLSLGVQAQLHRITKPAAWVEHISVEGITMQDTSCSRGGTEYLLADRQYHLGEQRSYFRLVTRLVTTEAVQNGSRVEVDVDPSYQKLELHSVRIIRNGQAMEQLDAALINVLQRERDLNAFLYDGTRSVVLELQDVRPGDIIDQSYTIQGNDAAGDGRFHRMIPTGFAVPLARQYLRFIVPAGRKLHFKSHLMDEEAEVRNTKWGTEHVWSRKDIPCILAEDGVPAWYAAYPELQASEFTDLEDLRQWAITQFDVDMKLDAALSRVVEGLARITDPLARIDSAIHIVQRQVRYLGLEDGISAYRPKPPAKVFAQRFGDCKDRSLLLVALLREVGVQAWPALVHSSKGLTLDRHLPRPGIFDHCIAMIEHGGERFWVDPTMAHNQGRLDQRYTPDMGLALVVDPQARGWMAMRTNQLGIIEVHETYTLDHIGGGAELEVESRYKLRQADRLRSWFAGQSIANITEQYRDFYRATFDDLVVVEPLQVLDDVVENVFVTRERYTIGTLWDTLTTGGYMFSVSPDVLKDYMDKPTLRSRTTPYALSDPVDVMHRITLHMPEPWSVNIGTEVIEGFGVRYENSISADGATVDLIYRYRSDSLVVQPEDMPAFYAQQKRIEDDLGMQFTHGGAVGGFALWDEIQAYGALLAMLALCLWGAWRVYLWDPEPHAGAIGLPVTGIGGWMVLPMIGLFISPLRILYDIYDSGSWFFQASLYVPQLEVKSKPLFQLYILFFQFQAIAMLGLVLITLVLFLNRRTSVALLMKVIYIGSVVFLFLDMVLYEWLDLQTLFGEAYDARDLGRAFFSAAIWVPFFSLSERVRTTFVQRKDVQVPVAPDTQLY